MSVFPLVKGTRLRITKVNACGMPVAGPANFLVTKGFVTFKVTAEMKDRDNLEQTNAEGRICVADTTPAERKYYTVEIELCNVNTGLITLCNGWEQVLNYADVPVGLRDQRDVEADLGVMFELWTGGKADDDCPMPTSDDYLTAAGSGKKYGYFAMAASEFELGDIEVGAQISTLNLSAISLLPTGWGRGPYNVVAIDSSNTPGRLLEPMNNKQHWHLERTPIAPPDVTPGSEPVALEVGTIFTDPNFYYGGPMGEPAADVAPDQPALSLAS